MAAILRCSSQRTWRYDNWKQNHCWIRLHGPPCTVRHACSSGQDIEGCSLLLVNIHGPHSQHDVSEIQGWWSAAKAVIRNLLRGDQLVMGGDLNSRAGPSEACTGTHGPDTTHEAVECAIELCHDLGLLMANTFEGVMGAHPAETWRDRRPDYIAIPACCLGSCKVVGLDFDLLNPHEDHRALCLISRAGSTLAPPLSRPLSAGNGLELPADLRQEGMKTRLFARRAAWHVIPSEVER